MEARPLLVFAHANGFPGAVYRRLYAGLERAFDLAWLPAIGHDPRRPVTEGWPHLIEELLEFTERHARGRRVLGMGHSLGGYLTCLAAIERPDLYRAIIVLDAPMLGGLRGAAFAALKRVGLADRVTPARSARRRRSDWPDRAAALAHFRGRGAFRAIDEEGLSDYVAHALRPGADGALELLFDPGIEASIYRSLPHDMGRRLRALRVPAGYLGGRESAEARQVGLALARRHFRFRQVPGGHLFPLEQPEAAARAVIAMARTLESVTPGEGASSRGRSRDPV